LTAQRCDSKVGGEEFTMPIYEYACEECGHQIEVIQKINARAPGRCEECSGKLKKLVSKASFQLKGGGWYADGYSEGATGPTKPKKKKASTSKGKKAASA